jgi:hypothetical protein
MKLTAFIKTPIGLYKVYDHGSDWQVLGPNQFEQWFSSWAVDRAASLKRAIDSIPSPLDIVYTGENYDLQN